VLEPGADEPVLDPPDALEPEPAEDTSVRMNPPPLALLPDDAPPLVAEPDVPVALELPDFRQPVNVTVCPELELEPAVDPDWPVGDCPPVWADAATASAAENTVPKIK
jgi:hypothetical protein